MTKKYVITLLVVLVAIFWLRKVGGNGLPFDAEDVDYIKFIYSYEDTTAVLVEDEQQVARLMATLNVGPKGPCLCAHEARVILSVHGEEQTASVCGHCFNLVGRYHGFFTMPEEFSKLGVAYRDSAHLRVRLER